MSVILDKCVAMIDFQLRSADGTLLNGNPSYSYIHGMGNVISGMEQVLAGKSIGEEVSCRISAADGFGVAQDFEPIVYDLQQFGESFDSLYVGQGISFRDDHGNRVVLYVVDLNKDFATFTINHPWAGKELQFDAKILDIRCATEQEIDQGYPIEDLPASAMSCSCC